MSPYLVWCPEIGETRDDAITFHASCAECAAEAWLGRTINDGARYTMGYPWAVSVLDPATGTETRWSVIAEFDVRYSASEVSDG